MINCIALDDEPMALEVIKSLCDKIPFINLSHTFTQVSLAKKYLKKYPVDLIFLDIQMPDLNGIDFYKSLEQKVMVIFTTAYNEYAVEGFNVKAVDYLLKPIELDRFSLACKKAQDYYEYLKMSNSETPKSLYVRSEYALVRILFSDIRYMETMDDYIKIYTREKKPILTLMSLKKMSEKLPKNKFVRVHQSYIVSLSKIVSIRGNTVSLQNIEIPIGSSYKRDFISSYTQKK